MAKYSLGWPDKRKKERLNFVKMLIKFSKKAQ